MLSRLTRYDEIQTLELISSLVDKHLVKPALEKLNQARFILLDSIREYAWDEILRLGELEELKEDYVNIYLSLTKDADTGLQENRQAEWFNSLDDEFMNINLALEICLTSTDGSHRWEKAYQILDHCHRYWMVHGHSQMASQYIARARKSVDVYGELNPSAGRRILEIKAKIYSLSGSFAWASGNYTVARDWHESASHLYKKLDDNYGLAESLNNLAVNFGQLGDYQAALKFHEMGNVLQDKLGDRRGQIRQLNYLGNVFQYLGQTEFALARFEQGLTLARELNDVHLISALINNIAHLKVSTGQYAEAITLLESSLDNSQQTQTPYLRGWSLAILGLADIQLGEVERAIEAVLEGIPISQKITDMGLKINFLEAAAFIFVVLRRADVAGQIMGALERIRAESHSGESPADALALKRLAEQVSGSLGQEKWESAKAAGASMSPESALALAASQLEQSIAPVSITYDRKLLTEREHEVLKYLANGLSNEEISAELVVVLKTVEKHVANILRKLGVKNRTEAAAWAMKQADAKPQQ